MDRLFIIALCLSPCVLEWDLSLVPGAKKKTIECTFSVKYLKGTTVQGL